MPDTSTDAKAKAGGDAGRQDQNQDGRKGGRRRKGKRREGAAGDQRPREGGGRPREGGRRGGGRNDRNQRGNRKDRSEQPLTAGLFAGVADREMPCRVAGCKNTWTWYGTQQIRSLGKPPPKRMCAEHLAEFEGLRDREIPCRNSWCTNTWTWTRGAQLYMRERQEEGPLKPPSRLCESCFNEERNTQDVEVPCRISECSNTWTWTRQAQLRHRAWVRRQQAKIEAEEQAKAKANSAPASAETEVQAQAEAKPSDAPTSAPEANAEAEAKPIAETEVQAEADAKPSDAPEAKAANETQAKTEVQAKSNDSDGARAPKGKRRKRKRKSKRKPKLHEGPPEKLCQRCHDRLSHLEPIEVPCKVHGCTKTWTWDREGQLRAWAAHDKQENVNELPQPPRRMCNSCFEFIRAHPDREVPCGRPGCDKTWTYKTGAQLQDYLAGRTLDPVRLCEECSRQQFIASAAGGALPEGSEIMPCQVSGCTGTWVYVPGMTLAPVDPNAEEASVDRMCDNCRIQRGEPARDPRRAAPESSASANTNAADAPTDAADASTDAADAASPPTSDSDPSAAADAGTQLEEEPPTPSSEA
ncbi:hypothetical protein G6O69_09840 [Pseudenhygromyxa sp. WMMC2535]|uniref:hypothetical protein n=1 Tax=Pseudenhygromyxa sp. WMMC2535 TaxID=2712867 RepID=UPI0015524804|nr:hypothetical protein [Pseudenhygromyxa sp. WMMC2535]NVB38133.1 hypothetical protein [Pseudenhygromyxa sp. WMMC2535]